MYQDKGGTCLGYLISSNFSSSMFKNLIWYFFGISLLYLSENIDNNVKFYAFKIFNVLKEIYILVLTEQVKNNNDQKLFT